MIFYQSPVTGNASQSPILSPLENDVQHVRRQYIGRAHPITKTEDLPRPLFGNWKSARSLWKCYLLIVQCLPGPVEQQKESLACWQNALDGQFVQEDWLRVGTKFVWLPPSVQSQLHADVM